MPKVTFEYGLEPALNALAYLQQRVSGLTRLKAFKLLYLADKRHLELYGRPITGDSYVAMQNGPVPSNAYDYVTKEIGGGKDLPHFDEPDLDKFSDSEQEVLDEIISKYGRRSASALVELSHDSVWQRAWEEAEAKGKGSEPIPWERIIEHLVNGSDILMALLDD